MLSRLTILLLFLSLLQGTYAQSNGYVRDAQTSRGLEEVNIYLFKDTLGVGITDKLGRFDLQILRHCAEGDTLVFSHVGYELQRLTVRSLRENGYQVFLSEASQSIGQVTVTALAPAKGLDSEILQSMPSGLFSFGSFLADGKIYVVAGDETGIFFRVSESNILRSRASAYEFRSPHIYVYDIASDSWETKPCRVTKRAGHTACLYNNRIFIVGGVRYSTNRKLEYTDEKLEIYDLAKDTLYVDPVNPHQALNFTSFVYQDMLYLVGGSKRKWVFWDKIHALDLKSGCWYEMGEIPKEVQGEVNGVLVDHTVYFFGGSRRRFSLPSDSIYSLNLQRGEWRRVGRLKEGVVYPGLATHGDYVFIYEDDNLQIFNWRTGEISSYALKLGLSNAALHYYNDKLYVVGGCHRNGEAVSPAAGVNSVDIGWLLRE